jgi:hypothetical protein
MAKGMAFCIEEGKPTKDGEPRWWCDWHAMPSRIWGYATFISKGDILYWFNGLYYEEIIEQRFRDCVSECLSSYVMQRPEDKYSINKADQVLQQILDHTQLYNADLDLSGALGFKNGYLTETAWLPATDPGNPSLFKMFYATRVIPYNYEPNAACAGFKYLMSKIYPDEELLIYLAYCMLPIKNNYRHHEIWWGEGNNGKTQLAEHFGALNGDAVAYIALNSILTDKHAMVGLRGKYLNISSEIKGVMLNVLSLDRVKGLTTDAWLTGRDVYESQRVAKAPNTNRFLATANDLPYSEYMSDDKAFFERWKLRHFEYVWKDEDWDQWKDEDGATKHTFDKIFKQEAEGILAYILSFRNRIGELSIKWKETQEEWVCAGNSAIAFLHNLGIDDEHDTPKRKLFEEYQGWCKRNERKKLTYQTFFKTLKQRGYNEIRKYETDEYGGKVSEQYIEALGYSLDKENIMICGKQKVLIAGVINK